MLAKPKDQKETRAQLFGETLPELPPGEHLADHWRDMGYAMPGMMGAQPFTWQEVQAFAQMRQCDISPVEAQCLVDMSRAYATAVADTNPLSIAPMERRRD